MKTYKLRDVKYWFDRETRVWWAARYDADGNQIGNAVHSPSRDGIRREIDACLSIDAIRADPKVETVRDERVPGDGSQEGLGNGIWAYLAPGWRCIASDSHACHEWNTEALGRAVRWAEPCPCPECLKNRVF